MAQRVAELLDGANPTVAPYAKDGEALLRVTAKAETREQASEMCERTIEKIREKIGGYIYSTDSENLEETVVRLLKESGKKVALAESCTGGYIAKRITDVPGSSEVFEYGIVSYSNEVKQKLLGVKSETLAEYTEVSAQTAAEMAEGVRKLSGADFGISVTGISGPGGGSEDKPVGLSYIGFACDGGTKVREVRTGKKEDSREYNRYVSASNALHMIIQFF
jgi:nicotinamide-nucleotide amidase